MYVEVHVVARFLTSVLSDEFVKIIKHTVLHEKMPFNFESEFLRLHFGKDLQRKVTYAEFTQLIHVSGMI